MVTIMSRHTKCGWTLINVYDGDDYPVQVTASDEFGQLGLYPEGYGGRHCDPPDKAPVVMLENRDGALYLLVWADYHDESPTHIIPLGGAKIPQTKGDNQNEDA